MKSTTSLAFGIFLAFCASTAAAQSRPPQYEHLKKIEGFVGTWEGPFDPPGEMPPGIVRVKCRWVGNQTYLLLESFYRPEKANFDFNVANTYVGFNGKTGSTHAWSLEMYAQGSTPATITKNKLVMKNGKGFDFDGKEESSTVVCELQSPDKLVMTTTNVIKGGKPRPNEPVIVMKRVE